MKRNAGTAICVFVCSTLLTQAPAVGQVVQLPSISTFSYSGSVMVPDRGTTSLGGVRRSAMGSSRRGLSRGFGSSFGHTNASITATIIDHQAIDRQIRGVEADRRGSGVTASARTQNSARLQSTAEPQNPGRRQRPGRSRGVVDPDAQGKALVRYARAKYREGDHRASLEGYRAAMAVLSPKLRGLAEIEFRRVFPNAAKQPGVIPR